MLEKKVKFMILSNGTHLEILMYYLLVKKKFKFKFTNKEFNTINSFKEILNIVKKRKIS